MHYSLRSCMSRPWAENTLNAIATRSLSSLSNSALRPADDEDDDEEDDDDDDYYYHDDRQEIGREKGG